MNGKRSNGTGSVVQIGPTRFRVRVTNNAGVRKSMGVYETREHAEDVLAKILVGLQSIGKLSNGTVTWAAYADEWLTKHRRCYADKSKVKVVKSLAPWAEYPLASIHRHDVHPWLESMYRSKKYSHNYVNGMKSVVGSIFARAVMERLIEQSPVHGYRGRRVQETEAWTYLTKAELDEALHCERLSVEDRYCLGFLVGTGLRKQEFLLLRDDDVDLDRRMLTVRRGNQEGTTKSRKVRHIPLLPLAELSLRGWLETRDELVGANPCSLVWPGTRGGLRSSWWTTIAGRVCAATGAHKFRPHDLRHTFAASLVSGYFGRRWRLEEIRPLLGHASMSETERYAHIAESAISRAADEDRDQSCWSKDSNSKPFSSTRL